ncbi:MAG TPA: ABC transporter permease [Methylomirabilota bacterium]|jgi:peptide/nickel transport system permease protein|nr:ABC transporter permease [Methylomirabilota bacterium]
MLSYVGARLLQAVPVLFLSSVVVFLFIRLVPGDPAVTMAGPNATPDQVAALRRVYQLDRPLPVQYLTWLGRLVQGDLGVSYTTRRPVAALVAQRLPATLHLAVGTMLVMLVVGGPLGVVCAVRPRWAVSRAIAILNAVALATPTFWLGILLLLLFAVSLRWVPPSGFVSITEQPLESMRLLVLPCLTLGASGTAIVIRFMRASMSEVMHSDFIRTAHAKGLRESAIVTRHVLRVAALPVVTVLAVQFGYLLGGAVITEAVFGWPGVGRLTLDAIGNRDYLIVQAMMLFFVAVFIAVNVIADLCYAILDPRIRLAG